MLDEKLVENICRALQPTLDAFQKLARAMTQALIDLDGSLNSYANMINAHMRMRPVQPTADLPWGARRFLQLLKTWSRDRDLGHSWTRHGPDVWCTRCLFRIVGSNENSATRKRITTLYHWPPHRIRDFIIPALAKLGSCDQIVVYNVMES